MLSKEELYNYYVVENHTLQETAKKFNCGTITISRYCKRYNIDKQRRLKLSKDEIYNLYITQNLTMEEIGKKFNKTRKDIARIIHKYNITKEYIPTEKLIKAFNECTSYTELAKKLNVNEDICSKYCKKNNLKYLTSKREKFYTPNNIQLIKMLSEDKRLTIREIGKKLPIPRNYISDIIKENNIYSISFNGLNIYTRDMDTETLNILHNKDLLVKYIKENNIVSANHLSRKLGVSCTLACKKCSDYDLYNLFPNQSSSEEDYIAEYVGNYFHVIKNDRSILDGKEIDIYIPDKKIGIEFNGDYWHGEKFVETNYHQSKSTLAESKGVFIYHIFEYEWRTKQEQILNQLNNILGINTTKIYARKCVIRTVSEYEARMFLCNNHLQGSDRSSVKLGLYYDDELVSLMTFVKPRFNKNYQWELSRFCSKAGCNVIGGASKLWKHFITNYNPESVISYSNISHTRGNLYGMLGFTLLNISNPNYVWCNNKSLLSRYQCQKHKLLEQGYNGSSEVDIMHNRGYHRIFDCGNKVWVWKKEIN